MNDAIAKNISPIAQTNHSPLKLWDGRPARPVYLMWDGRPARPGFLPISCSIDPDRP